LPDATLVIRGGTVVGPEGLTRRDVAVAGAVVVGLAESIDPPQTASVLDAGGCLVGPGLVDLHTHLRHPGRVDRGIGVGHGDDGRVAAERGGPGAGLDRLGLLVAGLPQVRVEVDQAGGDHAAAGVEGARPAQPRAERGDDAALDEHVGGPLAGPVEHPAAANNEGVRQPVLPIRAAGRGRPCAPRRRWRPAR